jgi:hypothetical protein
VASTSTLPDEPHPRLLLRLRQDRRTSLDAGSVDADGHSFALHPESNDSQGFELADGTVQEYGAYVVDLLSRDDLGTIRVRMGVNDGEMFSVVASRIGKSVRLANADYTWYCLCSASVNWHLFLMTYGFAKIHVSITTNDGHEGRYCTRSIPCLSSGRDQPQIVSGMLEELAGADRNNAIRWLLAGRVPEDDKALVNGIVTDPARSLEAYLALIESVLVSFEAVLPFLRTQAHCKTMPATCMMRPRDVRTVGRREITWVVQNMSGESPKSLPRSIRTEKTSKSFDNYENRAITSFLAHVVRQTSKLRQRSVEDMGRLRAIRVRLASFDVRSEDDYILGLVLVNAYLKREIGHQERIQHLYLRGQRLLSLLESLVPCKASLDYVMPRQTKVFQEVRPYASLFRSMQQWRSFGTYSIERDALLLGTLQMDRLYEYYALYKMLDWLDQGGFRPDESLQCPVQSFRYSLEAPHYSAETQVNNVYCLSRGDERIHLYYQPVIYGDDREEAGILLHRTTSRKRFGDQGFDAYWQPDFLIVHETPGRSSTTVVDAKFRTVRKVIQDVIQDGSDSSGASTFDACLIKYVNSMAKTNGDPVDGLWLLCGRERNPRSCLMQSSSWARRNNVRTDGIVTLAPGANRLDVMFAAIGIAQGPVATEDVDDAVPKKALLQPEPGYGSDGPDNSKSNESDGPKLRLPVLTAGSGGRNTTPTYSSSAETIAVAVPPNPSGTPEKDEPRHQAANPDPRLDATTYDLVVRLCESMPNPEQMTEAKASQKILGLSHPLLRSKAPVGHERGNYSTRPLEVSGSTYYIFSKWLPSSRNRLVAEVRRSKRSSL